jgi:phytoene dehydrogenase-like protein
VEVRELAANQYDAIVIGGGHNGLVAAAYMTKYGKKVIVLEARGKTGGATDTSSPWPDAPEFKVTTLSYVMSLMPHYILEDLKLKDFGYKINPLGMGYLPQTPSVLWDLTVEENLATFESLARAPNPLGALAWAKSVELEHRLTVRAGELSGGERRRLELARALEPGGAIASEHLGEARRWSSPLLRGRPASWNELRDAIDSVWPLANPLVGV